MPGRQVDHQVPVCLASLGIDQPPLEDALQGVAQVPLVGPVIPVELRVHQFAVFVEGRLGGQDAAVHDALRIEQFLQLRQIPHGRASSLGPVGRSKRVVTR